LSLTRENIINTPPINNQKFMNPNQDGGTNCDPGKLNWIYGTPIMATDRENPADLKIVSD